MPDLLNEIPLGPRPAPDQLAVNPADERAALRFRHSRVLAGALGVAVREFGRDQPDTVRAFVGQAKTLRRESMRPGELHRGLTPYVAAAMTDPVARRGIMAALDETATSESDRLKQEASPNGNGLDVDVLVAGDGVQGAIFTAAYRAEFPGARIVSVGKGHRLGGQFRSYGDRPTFRVNSRGFRPERQRLLGPGLPGRYNNLNSFGSRSPVQPPDITSETYPTNIDMGDAAALLHRMSGLAILGAELNYVGPKTTYDDRYRTYVDYNDGKDALYINPRQIVIATGAGTREAFKNTGAEEVWSAEDLFAHFGNPNNPFPMKEFIGKRGAIIGGGDTGRVVAELFARLAPKEAYGKSVVQLGNPVQLDWFGTDFDSREEFCEKTRSRYAPLAPFIVGRNRLQRQATMFMPYKRKVTSLIPSRGRTVILTDDTGLSTAYGFVIVATPIKPRSIPPLYGNGGEDNGMLVQRAIPEFNDEIAAIARRSAYGAYTIGPAAQMPLTQFERDTFADGIKENTAAIWANVIRTELFAREMARRARATTR